jgi:hypothetical protein
MSTETELAWAAGFFDGEGYVGCSQRARDNCRSISCSITQSSYTDDVPTVLARFQRIVGIGNIYKKSTAEQYKPRYAWSVQTIHDVEVVYSLLSEYLDEVKEEQFMNAIKEYIQLGSYIELGLCKKRLHKRVEGDKQCKECTTSWQLEHNETRKLERKLAKALGI